MSIYFYQAAFDGVDARSFDSHHRAFHLIFDFGLSGDIHGADLHVLHAGVLNLFAVDLDVAVLLERDRSLAGFDFDLVVGDERDLFGFERIFFRNLLGMLAAHCLGKILPNLHGLIFADGFR